MADVLDLKVDRRTSREVTIVCNSNLRYETRLTLLDSEDPTMKWRMAVRGFSWDIPPLMLAPGQGYKVCVESGRRSYESGFVAEATGNIEFRTGGCWRGSILIRLNCSRLTLCLCQITSYALIRSQTKKSSLTLSYLESKPRYQHMLIYSLKIQ